MCKSVTTRYAEKILDELVREARKALGYQSRNDKAIDHALKTHKRFGKPVLRFGENN